MNLVPVWLKKALSTLKNVPSRCYVLPLSESFFKFGCFGSSLKMSRDMTKPTKWVCAQRRLRSAWASAQSDQSLRCPHEESYPLITQQRLWSDWTDAQADLSVCWVHTHFVGFVMSRLKCSCKYSPFLLSDGFLQALWCFYCLIITGLGSEGDTWSTQEFLFWSIG